MSANAEGYPLTIVRRFAAPRALVYRAWTDVEQLVQWWGPRDFTVARHSIDVRVGGAYRIAIRSHEGDEHVMAGRYEVLDEASRIVMSFRWENDPEALDTRITVSLVDADDGGTELTFTQAPFVSAGSRDSHRGGWNECLDRLGTHTETRA